MICNDLKINLNNTGNINSNKLSTRFKKAVDNFILEINNLYYCKNNYKVNQILITLSSLMKETTELTSIIDNYSNFNNTSTELFGGLGGFFKKLRYCNDKKAMNQLIHARVDFFIKKLTLAIIGEEFPYNCTDKVFKEEFAKAFKLIIINLYEKYQFTNFEKLYLGKIDFKNFQFNKCNFSYSKWDLVNTEGSTFTKCNFNYSGLAIAGENTKFINCDVTMSNFVNADIKHISFYNCRFSTTMFNSELELSEYATFYKENDLIRYENLINDKEKVGWRYLPLHTFSFAHAIYNSNTLLTIKKHIFTEVSDQLTCLEDILKQIETNKERVNPSFLINKHKLTLVTECLINSEVQLNINNVCGILNNNVLQLYHADSLWAWLIKKPTCPKTRANIYELWETGCILSKKQINKILEKKDIQNDEF